MECRRLYDPPYPHPSTPSHVYGVWRRSASEYSVGEVNHGSLDCLQLRRSNHAENHAVYFFLGTVISLSFMGATSAVAADTLLDGIGTTGTVYNVARCPANNFVRAPNNSQVQTTSLQLRNFDPVHPIRITRLVIYNAPGTIIYDSKIAGLPAFTNQILGPNNNTLNPHQTSVVSLDTFIQIQEQTTRPLQLLVESSSAWSALPLHVAANLIVSGPYEVSPGVFDNFAERSRSGGECNSVRRLQPLN